MEKNAKICNFPFGKGWAAGSTIVLLIPAAACFAARVFRKSLSSALSH